MTEGKAATPRDRAATEDRIVEAARQILVKKGPAALGINAVARAARVDKQLIYRYFDGLDGLLAALGERIAAWWVQRLTDEAPGVAPSSYPEMVEQLALRLLQVMRTEPLARQSLLWELADTAGAVQPLIRARSRAMVEWSQRVRGDLVPPAGIDAPALNALIIGAVSYVALAEQNARNVAGLASSDPANWDRIEQALIRMIRGAYRLE